MKIIYNGIDTGKTKKLIIESSKTKAYIVCRDLRTCNRINIRAIEMGLIIPYPLSYDEFLLNKQSHIHFLIDDVEDLLRHMCIGTIDTITLTNENMLSIYTGL